MEDYEDSPWKIRIGAKQGEKTRGFFSAVWAFLVLRNLFITHIVVK